VQNREVFVPAVVDGVAKFAPYDGSFAPEFGLANTLMPPKDLLFPQTQKMYNFRLDEGGNYVIEEYDDSVPRAIVGIRPCDMRSLACLDDVFLTKGFVDDFYANAREKLLTVCIGCAAAAQTCFCDSMGVDPTDAPNADIMLRDAGDDWLVEAHTPAGEQALAEWKDNGYLEEGDPAPTAVECTLKVQMEGVKEKLDGMFDAPLWDDLAVKCLNCGTCTYVCPTCHCFDISQENRMKEGVRFRCWDSCMFSEYTAMAGGHNPRPQKKERVRNRFMHKLNYFEERYGKTLCVGCGRCVEKCPVALDITRLIDEIGAYHD
jgi:ferredoxin